MPTGLSLPVAIGESSFARAGRSNGSATRAGPDRQRRWLPLSRETPTRELRRLGINLNQVAHRLNADDRHQVTPLERTDIMRALHVIDLHVDFVERVYAQAAPDRAEVDHRRR